MAVTAAVGFALAVALLFIADIGYVVEFAINAPVERTTAVGNEFFNAGTGRELLLSIVTATITTLIALIIGIPAGYALSRLRIPGKIVVDTFVDAAIVLPPLILGVSLLVFFSSMRRLGEAMGAPDAPNPLIQGIYDFFVYQRPGIVLAQLFVSTALCIRAIKSTFDSADPRVESVAMTLGCTPFGAFWRVALPQASSGILAGAVLAWSYAIGLFAPVAIFAGTVRGRTAILPTRTYLEVSVGHLEIAILLTLAMALIAMTALIALKIVARPAGGQNRGII